LYNLYIVNWTIGKTGIYTTAGGLKIAYLSGKEGVQSSPCNFTQEECQNLQILAKNEPGIDILLTAQWPFGITTGTPMAAESAKLNASKLISQLALLMKPRYHFCGLEGIHFERQPYRNHKVLAESAVHTTRFIGLSKVGNPLKAKWLYAFGMIPFAHIDKLELLKSGGDVTDCPYNSAVVRGEVTPNPQQPQAQFFYDMSPAQRGGRGRGGHQQQRGGRRPYNGSEGGPHAKQFRGENPHHVPPSPCWFCLSSPKVEKHLVISIGTSTYLTLAKGGLTEDHLLILPIGHIQSTIQCPPDVLSEITRFKLALTKYFQSINKSVIFFERNYKSPHLQIQVVPVPAEITNIKNFCLEYSESQEVSMEVMPKHAQLYQMVKPGIPYYYFELPDGEKLFVQVRKGIDIHFGREMMASECLLNMPDRVDWRKCTLEEPEEREVALKVRDGFKPFDFTLE